MIIYAVMLFFGPILLALFTALFLLMRHHARHPECRSAPLTAEEWEDWCDDILFPPYFDPYTDDSEEE